MPVNLQPDISPFHSKARTRSRMTLLLTLLCIVVVTMLCIGFNGGIATGSSNHVGLLPVVRRLIDPNYLPGDFNISLRLYHHRVFAWLIVGLTKLLGEERGLILLHLTGATLMSTALWYLCRTLRLSLTAYLAVGFFLATGFLWTGYGLEENTFIGNQEVQPPLFAHSFVLLATACLLRERYRWAAFFAGMTVLFHLQIGVICTLMIVPLYVWRLRTFALPELLRLAACYLLPAAPAIIHLLTMLQRGLLRPASGAYSLPYYIDFRHPHHFALMSAAHAWWTIGHVLLIAAAWYWLRRNNRAEAPLVSKLLTLSLTLVVLALIHFTDYYLLRHDRIANIQMIRLSPLLTVLGTICLMLLVNVWLQKSGNSMRLATVVNCGLMALALGWGVYSVRTNEEREFYLGHRRYADKEHTWNEMCNWIKANGPRDTVYLTPPARDGFTVLTDRSNVVEFKINPDGALQMTEWFARLFDLTGGELPQAGGLKNRDPLNKAYGALTAELLTALGRKYHAGYAVLLKSTPVNFAVLYENKGFKLVRLPQ